MLTTPPCSRNQIRWMKVERTEAGEVQVTIEPYYSKLLDITLPRIAGNNVTGWQPSDDPRYLFALFERIDDDSYAELECFKADFERLVVIAPNKNIENDFSDELDFCMALDFNFDSPKGQRTDIGSLLYTAKYDRIAPLMSRECVESELVDNLLRGFMRLPGIVAQTRVILTPVPVAANKTVDLPSRLVKALSRKLAGAGIDVELMSAKLLAPKPAMKDEPLDSKKNYWQQVVTEESIELSAAVHGETVCIVDDLYQSGLTMWSFAKHLKNKGAKSVYGLCCVKSLRDDAYGS